MTFYKSILIHLLIFVSIAMGEYGNNANAAIWTLQDKWYNWDTGLWNDTWWQSGNIVTALAKFGSHDAGFKQTASNIVANTYIKSPNQHGAKEWKNNFYDDEGWWALGWIASYDLTGDKKYLDTAKDLFEDMATGWTTPCNGGIWWDKGNTSIAAISNELFLSVAAHLSNRVSCDKREYYRDWALREWDWFVSSGVINSEHLINDGIDKNTCENDNKTVWTYNQGVILGGLAELAKATNNSNYTNEAKTIADAAMGHLIDNGGILTEPRDQLDETSAQFKGAFVRGLAALDGELPAQAFVDFLKTNADSAWYKGRDCDGVIGPNWSGEEQGYIGCTSHASGLDVLVAAAQVA